MKFSIIIPSYLGYYKDAASSRDQKIRRAITSCLLQSYRDFEIIIVADGCEQTLEILRSDYVGAERLSGYLIPKQKIWSGAPRNFGIGKAVGEYLLYLDIDDYLGADHLANIHSQLNGQAWVYFDDYIYNPDKKVFQQRKCEINQRYKCGTSNICHRRDIPVFWDHDGYAHDWKFIRGLFAHSRPPKIIGGQYYVCHIPKEFDV